ncbi:MAG: hypothetical protein KAU89_08135 [Candidatus Thorarchaeota archaeon]|jgi:hypothetical protein|nr:hypothetical protein [Candidatus Thorarchaeota archaeon]
MFTHFRYPTKKQGVIWLKRRQNVLPSVIAQELDVSRPFVSKAQRIAEQRIEKLLTNAAFTNRIKVAHMSGKYGFAVGYCPTHKTDTYITYSPSIGVQIWFDHEGECGNCSERLECARIVRNLAREWEVPIPKNMIPTKAAKKLFEAIMRRLKWM